MKVFLAEVWGHWNASEFKKPWQVFRFFDKNAAGETLPCVNLIEDSIAKFQKPKNNEKKRKSSDMEISTYVAKMAAKNNQVSFTSMITEKNLLMIGLLQFFLYVLKKWTFEFS